MLIEPNRHDVIARRYPRLIRILKWLACLSDGEATGCILAYTRGDEYSSEAVAHFGGATKVLTRSIQLREKTRFLLRCAGCGHTLHEFRGLECRWEDDCTACEDAYLRAITESIQDGEALTMDGHWHLHDETGACYGDYGEFEDAVQTVALIQEDNPGRIRTIIDAPFCMYDCRGGSNE